MCGVTNVGDQKRKIIAYDFEIFQLKIEKKKRLIRTNEKQKKIG